MVRKAFWFGCIILMGAMKSYGQSLQPKIETIAVKEKVSHLSQRSRVTLGSCGQDTIFYTLGKQISNANQYAALPLRRDGNGSNGISHALQWFETKDSLYITGVGFYGALLPGMDPNDSILVVVEIYLGDTTGGFSNTTPTASDTILVTAAPGADVYYASFPNVLVTGSYGISIMNLETSNFYILLNDTTPAGRGENLSYARIFIGGFYSPWISLFNNNIDYDFLIFPIVTYPLHTQFTIPDTIMLGDTLRPINTSTYHYYSKFYNIGIFDNVFWSNSIDPTDNWIPTWDFGDGTQKKDSLREAWHVYTTPGDYMVALYNIIQPWTVSPCIELVSANVHVKDTAVTTISDHSLISDNHLFTMIHHPAQQQLSLRINPRADGPFTVTIYTMIGQTVYQDVSESHLINVPLGSLADGIYFVEVSTKTNRSVKRFVKSQ